MCQGQCVDYFYNILIPYSYFSLLQILQPFEAWSLEIDMRMMNQHM